MKPHHFQRVLLHIRFELNRFGSALAKLESYEFPSAIALKIVGEQQQEANKARSDLDLIETDFEDDALGASARLASEFRKTITRRRVLEILEKARSDEVPWSLIPSIESIAKQLLPSFDILITTTPDMNYMVGWGPLHAIIYLPKLHRANGFLHVLIGHELFHPIVTEFFVSERPKYEPKLRELCKSYLTKMGVPTDLFFPQRLDALLAHAAQQWEKALTELMCDMGAVSIFGPAALWTLSGFAATQEMNAAPVQSNQYYPPWKMRLRVAYDFLERVGKMPERLKNLEVQLKQAKLADHANLLITSIAQEQISFATNELAFEPMRELSIQVYDLVEACLVDAASFVESKSLNFDHRWTETLNEVPSLLGRLSLHVPPSELLESPKQESKAASITGIVMACWIERLRLEHSGNFELESFRRLCRLMLKAIEDSELKRSYLDWVAKK
jgi:hypothetical protein